MALCLQTGTGQSVGMATIYSAEPSCRALSAAKDAGWAGRVKQLPSAILSAVMSQRQQSAIEQWQLTPFWDSKEKHRNEMATKIPSHLAFMGCWSFRASSPSLFSLAIIIQMKASYRDYFGSAPHAGLQSYVWIAFSINDTSLPAIQEFLMDKWGPCLTCVDLPLMLTPMLLCEEVKTWMLNVWKMQKQKKIGRENEGVPD